MKVLLLILMTISSAFGQSQEINKRDLQNIYSSLDSMSGNEIMREEIFERDYGLLYEVATQIQTFYANDLSEANTTFKDHVFYLGYLFLSKEKQMMEDIHVASMRPLLRNMYTSVLQVLANYNWVVEVNGRAHRGQQVTAIAQFTGSKKQIKYNGSSLMKIFSAPLTDTIDQLLRESTLDRATISGLNKIKDNVHAIQTSSNPTDLSRGIHRASRRMIDAFDEVEDSLRVSSRKLERTGNVSAPQLILKIRVIMDSIKELKNYGRNYN